MSWQAWGAFAGLGIIWGLPYFFIKVSVQELSPFVVAFGRVMLATVILLPIAWRRGALRSLTTNSEGSDQFGRPGLSRLWYPFLSSNRAHLIGRTRDKTIPVS